MDNKKNSIYLRWGITAFLVIASSILFYFLINNFSDVSIGFNKFIALLAPLIDGLVIAYILSPIVKWFEVNVLNKFMLKDSELDNDSSKKSGKKPPKADNKDSSKVSKAINDIKNIKPDKKEKKSPEKKIRVIAILISLFLILALSYAFFSNVIPELTESINGIIKNYSTYEENLQNWAQNILRKYPELNALFNDQYFEFSGSINNLLTNTILPRISDGMVWLTTGVFSAVRAVINLLIGLILSFYILYNKELFLGQLKKLIYAVCKRDSANNLINNIRFTNKTFQGFLVGKCIDSLIIGLICFIVLTIIGTPYTLLVSVIIGVTNIIPLFGPFIGAIPSALLILMVDPKQALYFVIVIIVLQQFDGNILGPKILGQSTGLSGFWVVVALTIFGGLFGIVGMIIGVPTFAVIYTAIKTFINNRLKDKNLITESLKYYNVDFIDDEYMYIKIPKKDVTTLASNKSPGYVNKQKDNDNNEENKKDNKEEFKVDIKSNTEEISKEKDSKKNNSKNK